MRTLPVVAHLGVVICVLLVAGPRAGSLAAAGPDTRPPATQPVSEEVLTPGQRRAVERSVDRGLAWLGAQQKPDGSFPTYDSGQPAVTALCVLAFLSQGHLPDQGPYGETINKGLEFILACQHPDGLIARHYPSMGHVNHNPSHTAYYNHAIAGLCLSEAYGMTRGERARRMKSAIESALRLAFERRPTPKRAADAEGGWRYVRYFGSDCDSDLCMTSWYLMFLRSARNAGFEVPAKIIDEGLAFVRRCYDLRRKCFQYAPRDSRTTRAMVGAGILSLSLGGAHHTEMALEAGGWMQRHPFTDYGVVLSGGTGHLYSTFYSSQGMFQLGGRYWSSFYPRLAETIVKGQTKDGSWPANDPRDGVFGNAYATSLAVLTLTTPSQLLPIFQR